MRPSNCRQDVQIRLKMGLHIRPSSVLASSANQFRCDVRVCSGPQSADAKSPLELMSLGVPCGAVITLETNGNDAEEALRQLVKLVEDNFGIDEDELSGDCSDA